ncbi:MAG: cyclase family protein [Halanaerobium sp.]
MSKLIDLSYEIYNGMPVYPGDINVELINDKKIVRNGYSNHNLKIGMHTGTHLDLPAHMLEDVRNAADINLNSISGRAKLVFAAGKKIINLEPEFQRLIEKNDIVLIYTGLAKEYGNQKYYKEHPVIAEELADFLIKKEIKLLGFDLPSPDYSPFKIHQKLFENDIFILENLCNLEKLLGLDSFKLFVFPLKVRAEAAPCRVAAEI